MAVEAAERLEKDGKKARVVSMIGWELFEQQPQSYKASAISPQTPFCTTCAQTFLLRSKLPADDGRVTAAAALLDAGCLAFQSACIGLSRGLGLSTAAARCTGLSSLLAALRHTVLPAGLCAAPQDFAILACGVCWLMQWVQCCLQLLHEGSAG